MQEKNTNCKKNGHKNVTEMQNTYRWRLSSAGGAYVKKKQFYNKKSLFCKKICTFQKIVVILHAFSQKWQWRVV